MKNFFKDAVKNLRAARRLALGVAALPVVGGLLGLQTLLIKPLTGNTTAVMKLVGKMAQRLLGYKIKFSANSAPLETSKATWFLLNHQSDTDFVPAASKLTGSFTGIDEIRHWPVIGPIVKAFGYVGIRRSREYNPETRGNIVANLNAGKNVIMFPEGTTSKTHEVNLFHAGLLSALFNEKAVDAAGNDVALATDVAVQAVAVRVTSVNGAEPTDENRKLYSMHGGKALPKIWQRLQVRRIDLELTAFPPMDPHDFRDAKELANKAAADVASVVNPGQTEFGKPKIVDTVAYKP